MKQYNRIFMAVILVFVLAFIGMNFLVKNIGTKDVEREYRISINRIEKAIEAYEEQHDCVVESLQELSEGIFPHVIRLDCMKRAAFPGDVGPSDDRKPGEEASGGENSNQGKAAEMVRFPKEWLEQTGEDYQLFFTELGMYRIVYEISAPTKQNSILIVNLVLSVAFVLVMVFLIYIRGKIIKPFHTFTSLPYELSKGNLTMSLPESKNRYFGRFLWGMNLLRENMEENKARELSMQKEKKLLLLSLSHDIKTPLSAIKLYARALEKNLYQDEAKKKEIIENINVKADEIEGYIADIVKASNEDFLHFEVENKEFYTKDVLEQIQEYYAEKMELNHIAFLMEDCQNCLVFGDADRMVEVLQNIIENAIKYGDGREIRLDAGREEDAYLIRISNTGCELEEKELPHIFDSFFRGSNVEKKPGSGLGLYICRQLMHLMEGEITAYMMTEERKAGSVPENTKNDSLLVVQVAIRLA